MTYQEWKTQNQDKLNQRRALANRERKAKPIAAFTSETIEYLNAMEKWFLSADALEKAGNHYGADFVRGQVNDLLRVDGFNIDQLHAMGWAF